jgi:hypothetical protein
LTQLQAEPRLTSSRKGYGLALCFDRKKKKNIFLLFLFFIYGHESANL